MAVIKHPHTCWGSTAYLKVNVSLTSRLWQINQSFSQQLLDIKWENDEEAKKWKIKVDIREQNSKIIPVFWSTKTQELQVSLSAWNDIKRHSASVYCWCCQYGDWEAGQPWAQHWRVFINWYRAISVPTDAWPQFPADLLGFASDYGLQGNCFPFLPPYLQCTAADHAAIQVCSVSGKPSPLIKPSVRVLSLIWLHHDRQPSCPAEYRMRFFHPQL